MRTPSELMRDYVEDLEDTRRDMEQRGAVPIGGKMVFMLARSDSLLYLLLAGHRKATGDVMVLTDSEDQNDPAFDTSEADTLVEVLTADARYRTAFHDAEPWPDQWERERGDWDACVDASGGE